MLKDLKILNGNLELTFNEYTYEYTVTVEDKIKYLELDYQLESDCYLNIIGNELNNNENIVYLKVYNVDEEITYTLYVYKENSDTVSSIENYVKSLEVSSVEELSLYKVQILTISMFFAIIIIFSIIFRRKKVLKNNNKNKNI